jgi:excisionase family DNA binding protein
MGVNLTVRRGVTFPELADSYGVSRDTIKRLAKSGQLRTIYIGGRRIVPMSEVERIEREGIGGRKPRRAAQ